MSLMSKTKTVTHSVGKDVPTTRVPIRTDYQSWKITKRDALIPSCQSRSSEGIDNSVADLFSDFKKSHNIYSLHQSSNIPCSVQRSSYSSVTTTKTIASNLNPVRSITALSDTSTLKPLQNIDITTTSPTTIASNLNPVKSKVTLSETSSLKSLRNIDSVTARPTTIVGNLNPIKSKVTFSDRPTQQNLHNNDIVTARPALRDCPLVTKTSSTTRKITSSSHKVIVNKILGMADEEVSPHFQRRSIIDDMNILKTPVNDSLTRKTILTNVVPVTSLITEHNTISDEPTARNALRGDGYFLNTVFSKLDDSITQVEESQTLNSKVVKNISDACTYKEANEAPINPLIDNNLVANTHTSLTPEKGSESPVFTKEDELSTNMENVIPMNFSIQDTESFLIQAEDLDSSFIVEDKEENPKAMPVLTASEELDECITSIPIEIDLTVEDVPIEKSILNNINEESMITTNTIIETSNELKNTSSKSKRKLYKDNETPEKLFPTSGIIIDLPPLISPMNSDNTIVSEDVSYMIPDSTTHLTAKTTRNINKTTNKQTKLSIGRKVQNRQITVKRKLRDISSPKCPCDNESEKESTKRGRGRPRKDETIKRMKTSSKSGTCDTESEKESTKRLRGMPRKDKTIKRMKTSSKSGTSKIKKTRTESDIEYEYVSENLSSPKTRNMMINPRTRNIRSPLLLKKD